MKNSVLCVQRHNLRKNLFMLRNEITFFFSLPYIESFFQRLQAKHFRQCYQRCILRVHRKFLRKNTFFRRKIMIFQSFSDFGPFFRHYSKFLAESSKLHSKCRHAFRGFFENVFSLLLGMEQKDLVFCRRNSGRVVKLHSTCPQDIFEEESSFREKIGIFLSFLNFESFFLTGSF